MARIKSRAPNELLYSLFAFIIVVIAVHAVYVTVVRPKATAVLAEQRTAMQKDPNYVAERSVYVVIKDWEQESAIILALWAVAVIGYKARQTHLERKLLARDLVQVPEGMRILPEDVREHARPLEALPPIDFANTNMHELVVGNDGRWHLLYHDLQDGGIWCISTT